MALCYLTSSLTTVYKPALATSASYYSVVPHICRRYHVVKSCDFQIENGDCFFDNAPKIWSSLSNGYSPSKVQLQDLGTRVVVYQETKGNTNLRKCRFLLPCEWRFQYFTYWHQSILIHVMSGHILGWIFLFTSLVRMRMVENRPQVSALSKI